MKKKIQKKVEKKYSSGLVGGLIVLCLVTVLGFGAAVVAYSGSASTVFEGDCVNCTIEANGEDFGNFGAIDLPSRSNFTGLTDLNLTSELRFGNNDKLTNGYSLGFKVIDLNATSSAIQLNNTGETLYVYNAYLRIQTATTSLIAYQMGTTTSDGVDQGATCGSDDTCSGTTAGHASILDTGTEAVPTVGETYFKVDFVGTDTGFLGALVIPVRDGEYMSCNASTTPINNNETGEQAVQCVFMFYTLDD